MNLIPVIGISDERIKFEIVESNEVDGEHILAKVRGVFFVPDGKSRNGRFYPKELWENVVNDPEVKAKLKSKAMYGTVGHTQKIDDDAILKGLVSHIVTDMKIEGGKGIGEALILNTPAGKNLNTILQAGGSMFVSTRADGTFEGKHEGLPIVSPKTYNFNTVDFVLDAGFVEANPSLAESYNKLLECNKEDNNENKEGNIMSEKLIKMLSDSNVDLKVEVKTLSESVETLSEEKTVLETENKHLSEEMAKFEEATKKIKEMEDEKEAEKEEKEKAEKELSEFKELGESSEDVKKTLTNALAHIKKVNEVLGGFDNAKSALKTAIAFKKSVDEAGGLESLIEAKAKIKEMEDEKEAEEKEKESKELAEELGISEDKVKELLETNTADGIRKMFSALEENLDKDKYRKIFEKKKKKSESEDEDEDDMDDDDEISESKILSRSNANRVSL